MKRWIGFLLSLCLWLTGCAAPAAESVPARPPVTTPEMPAAGELRLLYDAAPDTLDLFADNSGERLSLAACTADTLLEFDDKGALCSALAESWEYDASSRVWTLTLCPDAQWVDEKGNPTAPVTAEDFVAAARQILDPAVSSPAAATLRALIENAEEYYTGLDADDPAEPIDFEAVGVAAPDARTLCYTLKKDAPGFPARLTDWPFLPLAPEAAASQLSCGPYCLAAYERCGEIVLQKNRAFRDAEHVFIDTVRLSYDPDASVTAPMLAAEGVLGYAPLNASDAAAWLSDPARASLVSRSRPEAQRSRFLCFNFDVHRRSADYTREGMTGWSLDERYEPENWQRAVQCEAFRQSIRCAVDRVSLYGDGFAENTITPWPWGMPTRADPFDPERALKYRDAAREELAEQGASFPVKVLLRCPADDERACERAARLAAQLEGTLGADYVRVIVEPIDAENYWTLVRRGGAYMLLECFWDADSPDPDTWTKPFYQHREPDGGFGRGYRYAYFAAAVTDGTAAAETVEEYFSRVETARENTDFSSRREAFAAAEGYLLDHALALPLGPGECQYAVSRLDRSECAYRGLAGRGLRGARLADHVLTLAETAWAAPEAPPEPEPEIEKDYLIEEFTVKKRV